MGGQTLLKKVWDKHTVRKQPDGSTVLFVGLHLIHEVTSPQAFEDMRRRGLKVLFPNHTLATVDHIKPTTFMPFVNGKRPVMPEVDIEEMMQHIERNTSENNILFFGYGHKCQGIIHVIAPELGLSQPGITIACGDSHTSTHGALGAVAFAVGTTQIEQILSRQSVIMKQPKVRKIEINGLLSPAVYAKDVILWVINKLGVNGGIGYAYEYSGSTIEDLSQEARFTLCNMTIEGGAKIGYVNPDEKTFEYLNGRKFMPVGQEFEKAKDYWSSVASDSDANYEDIVKFIAEEIEPMVTWGTNPGQSSPVSGKTPLIDRLPEKEKATVKKALKYMQLPEDMAIKGMNFTDAFIGSCTNGRIEDLRQAAWVIEQVGGKVSSNINALVVPGSQTVKQKAELEGLDEIFKEAGFEWRDSGCSQCLGMNPDTLAAGRLCLSTSNRNFENRMGPGARTMLASPATVTYSALTGEIRDVREVLEIEKEML